MGSTNGSNEKIENSPIENTEEKAFSEVFNKVDSKDESNEQGYLWMCAACDDNPTFVTIYDLFSHKKNHKSNFVDIKNSTDNDTKIKNFVEDSSEESELKEDISLIDNYSKCNKLSDNEECAEVFNEYNKESYINSPLSSASSDDIPLAALFGKNKIMKQKLSSKKQICQNKQPLKKQKTNSCKVKKKIKREVNSKSKKSAPSSKKSELATSNSDLQNINFKEEIKSDELVKAESNDNGYDEEDNIEDSSKNKNKSEKKTLNICKICNTKFPTRFSLSDHKKTHLFEDTGCYKCETCGKMGPKYDNFTRHLTTHHTNRVKSHQCNQCFKSYYNLAELKRHSLTHLTEKPFKCEHCGESFIKEDSLLIHVSKHTGVPYEKYTCDKCGKMFNARSSLDMHKQTHFVKTVFCRVAGCKYACHLQSQLRQHSRKHTGERPYQCSKCGKRFARSNDMKNHYLNVHEKIRPFECPFCPKKFALKGNLRTHIITHTNERPYLCAECGDKFNQQSTLKKHTFLKHSSQRTSNKLSKSKKISTNDIGNQTPVKSINEIKRVKGKSKDISEKEAKIDESNFKKQYKIPEKTLTVDSSKINKEDERYITQNFADITTLCAPIIQEIPRVAQIEVPQLTVSLPIQSDQPQTFILPTIILEPGLTRIES